MRVSGHHKLSVSLFLLSISIVLLLLTFPTNQTRRLQVRCIKVNSGCTDASACTGDAIANEDDGTCDYSCTGWVASDGTGPCAGAETLTYQGDVYTLVEIGDQCWFRENLRAEDFANGESIPTGDGSASMLRQCRHAVC